MEGSTTDETFDLPSKGTLSGDSSGDASYPSASRRGSVLLQANMAPITREFQFVDVNSVGSRRQARSHVMRQYLREKRKQQNVRLETSLHTPNSSAFTPLQWQKRDHRENPHALDELRLDLRPKSSGSTSESDDEFSSTGMAPIVSEDPILYNRRLPLPSPQTPMSAARKDPFASLPITLDHEGHELMDTYVTVIPGLIFRSDLHTTYLLNPIRDVLFKEALSNPLLFRANVLSFTAGYRARWYGFTETEQSRRLQNRALQEAEDSARQLQDGSKPTNGFIMGITSLAHWEDRWGSPELAHKHLMFAQSLMADRYDVTSPPRPREPCQTWLHWMHVTMGPVPDTVQRTFPSLHSCLRDFNELHLAHHSLPPRYHEMRRFRMFEPGTTAYKNLAVTPKVDSVPQEHYVYSIVHRINRFIRLACLLYIHFALWDYRESLEDMEEYLATLERIGIQHDLERYPSTPILLWAMLDGEDHPRLGDPARVWKVGDVLNQVKKLPFEYQEGLGDFLFALLSRQIPLSPTNLQRWESNLGAS